MIAANSIKKNTVYPRSWRKLHIAVDEKPVIPASDLTDRFSVDSDLVETLIAQIDIPVSRFIADGVYDHSSTHQTLSDYFSNLESIIPLAVAYAQPE